MGKAKKEHRKKVAARNQRVKADYKKFESAVSQFIEQSKKQEEAKVERGQAPTLAFKPQSAIDVALAEKNKLNRI